MPKVEYTLSDGNNLCCDEGQVNNAGECADFCPAATFPVDGVCSCGLHKVRYSLDADSVLCCDEGQVNKAGECADFCPAGTSFPVDGVCTQCVYSEFGTCSVSCGGGTQSRTLIMGDAANCAATVQNCKEDSCPGEC